MDRANKALLQQQEEEGSQQQEHREQVKHLYHYALCLQEAAGGFYNEGTARIYYSIAWYHYEMSDYSSALTYFLQCLRISFELYGEEHASTQLVLDDLCDLLEDMHLNVDYVNPVFESWALQDDAADLSRQRRKNTRTRSSRDDVEAQAFLAAREEEEEEGYLRTSLALLPLELDLERAAVFVLLALLAERQCQAELALSYYCQTLMILPQYLTNNHPRVLIVKKQSHQVVASLTPMMPAARRISSSSSSSSSMATTSVLRRRSLYRKRSSSIISNE
jgi:tetratricopeptide (TPR) repeat protein